MKVKVCVKYQAMFLTTQKWKQTQSVWEEAGNWCGWVNMLIVMWKHVNSESNVSFPIFWNFLKVKSAIYVFINIEGDSKRWTQFRKYIFHN